MKAFIKVLVAASLAFTATAPATAQADPFDTARYYITLKHNADALAIIDSGQFDVNMQNSEGYSLLMSAADAGNLEMVKALLERGADPNLKTTGGLTAYDVAMGTMVKAQLAKAMQGPNMTSARTAAGTDHSAAGGSNGSCSAVIAERANNGRSASMRPILRARDDIWYNHPDELALLLEDCVNANAKDDVGQTLLQVAAQRDRIEAAKVLLAHGASKSIKDKDGMIAADYAKSAEMKALLGPGSGAAHKLPQVTGASGNKKECAQKYQADSALCSDSTCRMRSLSKWQKCLQTGSYY